MSEHSQKKIARPSLSLFMTEGGRALLEFGVFKMSEPLLKKAQKGDGHPVMVLPGFMASDVSTHPLRSFLKDIGYTSYGWELGRNYGKVNFIEQVQEKAELLYQAHGEKVSLVGWSLGGVFAREVAKQIPHLTRQVITLGSPFAKIDAPNYASWVHDLISEEKVEEIDPDLLLGLAEPPSVPTTAIYSKEDGIVSWKTCLDEEETETRQNIQVRGSHIGLGVNMAVMRIIADRLNYSAENWKRFKPGNSVEGFLFYPSC